MVSGATLDIDSRVLFMVCIENEHMKMEKNFGIGTATSECNNFVWGGWGCVYIGGDILPWKEQIFEEIVCEQEW